MEPKTEAGEGALHQAVVANAAPEDLDRIQDAVADGVDLLKEMIQGLVDNVDKDNRKDTKGGKGQGKQRLLICP